MQYVVMDLEWNNVYGKKLRRFLNEIIEIGAVKLNDNLESVDVFSVIVRSQVGKKLNSTIKRLTNITNADLDSGIPFTRAISEFRKWIGKEDTVILTWGDTDIRTLIDNCRYFTGKPEILFMQKYADIQRFCQNALELPTAQQIGLSAAAELLDIDETEYNLHRALGDSVLSAECFRRTFHRTELKDYIRPCNKEFYERFAFKAKVIKNIDSPLVDKNQMKCSCDVCGKAARQIEDWCVVNQGFRGVFYCDQCERRLRFNVRFKRYYDRVDVKKSVMLLPAQVAANN